MGYIGNVIGREDGDGEQHKDSRFSNYEYFFQPLMHHSTKTHFVTALCKNCSRVESQCVPLPL